jgi:hypothetical protein
MQTAKSKVDSFIHCLQLNLNQQVLQEYGMRTAGCLVLATILQQGTWYRLERVLCVEHFPKAMC